MGVKRDRFDHVEEALLAETLDGGDLWPYSGRDYNAKMAEAVRMLEAHFGSEERSVHVVPSASGTSSIQIALGGLKIPPGSEVIVTPITDPGSVTPIIFHNAIPVFADVDADSGLITPQSVQAVLTDRTSAVIAVHLTGSPVDVPGLRQILADRGRSDIRIIEDVAQGLGASLDGVPLGMLGHAGCFSLNSHKHITVGEGGFVLLQDEDDFLRCHNFSDKHRDRLGERKSGEHGLYEGPGHSLRMSELQGAMLVAQLPKLNRFAGARHDFGMALGRRLAERSDLVPQSHLSGAYPTFFGFMFRTRTPVALDKKEEVIGKVRGRLKDLGVSMGGSYTSDDLPIYRYPLFQKRNFTGTPGALWPAELVAAHMNEDIELGHYDYTKVSCPEAEAYLKRAFWVRLQEGFTTEHAERVGDAIVEEFADAGMAERT